MDKVREKALEAYPEKLDSWAGCNVDRRIGYRQGYEQAIKDAIEWIKNNAGKSIYINSDECGFRSYRASGLAQDLEKVILGN